MREAVLAMHYPDEHPEFFEYFGSKNPNIVAVCSLNTKFVVFVIRKYTEGFLTKTTKYEVDFKLFSSHCYRPAGIKYDFASFDEAKMYAMNLVKEWFPLYEEEKNYVKPWSEDFLI